MILPPTIVVVSDSALKVLITPPAGVSTSKVLLYAIKFRKDGYRFWKSTRERSGVTQYVRHLSRNTLYEFKVVARYKGETSTSESIIVRAKTTVHKCTPYFSFPTFNVLVGQTRS